MLLSNIKIFLILHLITRLWSKTYLHNCTIKRDDQKWILSLIRRQLTNYFLHTYMLLVTYIICAKYLISLKFNFFPIYMLVLILRFGILHAIWRFGFGCIDMTTSKLKKWTQLYNKRRTIRGEESINLTNSLWWKWGFRESPPLSEDIRCIFESPL